MVEETKHGYWSYWKERNLTEDTKFGLFLVALILGGSVIAVLFINFLLPPIIDFLKSIYVDSSGNLSLFNIFLSVSITVVVITWIGFLLSYRKYCKLYEPKKSM